MLLRAACHVDCIGKSKSVADIIDAKVYSSAVSFANNNSLRRKCEAVGSFGANKAPARVNSAIQGETRDRVSGPVTHNRRIRSHDESTEMIIGTGCRDDDVA